MTVLAFGLFTLAALASVVTLFVTLRDHGRTALGLRAALAACPETLEIEWSVIERVAVPAMAPLRRSRAFRIKPRVAAHPGLDWPMQGVAA